ncbi:MAG: GNAT family N-acetyltransferase [Bacilli bacterium]|nr:GNAT family N-acetyltransferase [Bacilli bacterium]
MIEYKINSCKYNIKDFIKNIVVNEFNIDYWDEWLENQEYNKLQEKPNILISAEQDKKLIGICSIKELSKDECLLNSFYVEKSSRNKGIGSRIFNMCEDYANKYKKIVLCVDPNFKEAITFYENRDYVFDYYDNNSKELHYHKKIKGVDRDE